jgi:phosphate transport system substrate-binding protein
VVGGLRIAGSELKGNVDLLLEGFRKLHPGAKVSTNFMTSSEGALGMMSPMSIWTNRPAALWT